MLNKHFQEFIELLDQEKVKYLLIGGYAVGYHGFPRYTGDLDVFIAISKKNSERILKVFERFGFPDLGLTSIDFLEEEIVVEVGREPLKIQVLTGIDGVTFDECYQGKEIVRLGLVDVPFIGYSDLLRNKQSSPRAKDKIDLEELKRIKAERSQRR